RVLAHAELLGARAQLADDPRARASWQLDRADALVQGGELRPAAAAIVRAREADPDGRRALWVLRAIARTVGDTTAAARASYALAIADLDVVLSRMPKHSEALRLRAAIALDASDLERASALLWRYLATEISPQQRAAAEKLLQLAVDRADTRPRIELSSNATP